MVAHIVERLRVPKVIVQDSNDVWSPKEAGLKWLVVYILRVANDGLTACLRVNDIELSNKWCSNTRFPSLPFSHDRPSHR